jgi:DNA-directed RNA polymerase subunit E'/Rpb7
VENRCIPEGFVRNNSVSIITYSAGVACGEQVEFHVVYNCLICRPVENMIVDCVAKSITESAGIRAEVVGEDGSVPLTVFVSRDHNYTNRNFSLVKEGDKIQARIIGVNYEINDPMMYAIAYFVDPAKQK